MRRCPSPQRRSVPTALSDPRCHFGAAEALPSHLPHGTLRAATPSARAAPTISAPFPASPPRGAAGGEWRRRCPLARRRGKGAAAGGGTGPPLRAAATAPLGARQQAEKLSAGGACCCLPPAGLGGGQPELPCLPPSRSQRGFWGSPGT